jgi:uncharacterized repeat protein (TIGR03806 family)
MKRALVWGLIVVCAACGHSARHTSDAGMRDASSRDTGAPDATAHDGGTKDAGHADAGQADAGTDDAGAPQPPPRSHGLSTRVKNTTCFLNGSPPLDVVPISTTRAFKKLTATGARGLLAWQDKLAVIESAGRVRSWSGSGDGGQTTPLLDLGASVRSAGLRSAALRPDGAVLLASFVPADDPLRIVVARFAVTQGMADAGSQETLLTVPLLDATRAGGALQFLFDGTVLVAFGDGGDAMAAADALELAGKIARIDVSGPSGYTVPADNPFATSLTTKPEVYALGVGAPTSCAIDRVTGHVWCADAGDATRDKLLLVSKGASLGAILAFKRTGCGTIVGPVSRDARLPDIQGVLVFGAACSPTLQGMRFDGSLVRSQATIATLPAALAAFGEDADGHMFAIDSTGAVHALVRPATPAPSFPTTVSATGCVSDLAKLTPAASLIPFEVRAPLWSDGAKKHRYFVLPDETSIGFTKTGAWQFPEGTIFMKEFLLDDDGSAATPDSIMETRFVVKRSDAAWEGYSYMWDRARKDAFLLEGAEINDYPMKAGTLDAGGASVHRHTFPDRTQCLLCHNAAAGRALGLQTGRMNTDHDYDGFVDNQLSAMQYIGLFDKPLPAAPDELPRFPQPADTTAPIEGRARAWLYANCSHCHRPGGPTPVNIDFRMETALVDTNACGILPRFTISQIPGADIITPGDSAHSELFFRLSRRDQNQMPPIATLITDPTGLAVLQQWIDGLTSCP